ncbi:hypothetical protein [Streptomyces sp. AGS-58]|uniref:hypothetical protein n=1 Tax=unclassified Streptomyces TaxID=2593676 RepID=UPI0035A2E685
MNGERPSGDTDPPRPLGQRAVCAFHQAFGRTIDLSDDGQCWRCVGAPKDIIDSGEDREE